MSVTGVVVLLDFINKWNEEDSVVFELPVRRVPQIGESMDFEGLPRSGMELTLIITDVIESFYVETIAGMHKGAVRTEVSAVLSSISDGKYDHDDLAPLFQFYGGTFQDR
jgi:hypothetical protein